MPVEHFFPVRPSCGTMTQLMFSGRGWAGGVVELGEGLDYDKKAKGGVCPAP